MGKQTTESTSPSQKLAGFGGSFVIKVKTAPTQLGQRKQGAVIVTNIKRDPRLSDGVLSFPALSNVDFTGLNSHQVSVHPANPRSSIDNTLGRVSATFKKSRVVATSNPKPHEIFGSARMEKRGKRHRQIARPKGKTYQFRIFGVETDIQE